jgi:hypothetical protein
MNIIIFTRPASNAFIAAEHKWLPVQFKYFDLDISLKLKIHLYIIMQCKTMDAVAAFLCKIIASPLHSLWGEILDRFKLEPNTGSMGKGLLTLFCLWNGKNNLI